MIELDIYDKYSHAQQLVMKALVNQGGSTSETTVFKFLVADFSLFSESDSVLEMWDYLDNSTKSVVFEYANLAWCCECICNEDDFLKQLKNRMIKQRQYYYFKKNEDENRNRYFNDEDDELYHSDNVKFKNKALNDIVTLFE